MTQIDASPMPTGKAAAKADAGTVRDRGKGGQADDDAGVDSGKPRFGDHWRSILSGDTRKPDSQPMSADDGQHAGEKAPSARFGVLLRLPPAAFGPSGDAAQGEVSALSIDAANPGDFDISEVLAALKGAETVEASGEAAVDDALGGTADNESANAAKPGATADAGEQPAVGAGRGQGAATAMELAAPGAVVHPAVSGAVQPAGAGSAEDAQPTKARARSAANVANGPPDKGASSTNANIHLSTRGDAAQPAMKASVVHQATHFAPALGAANIQAITSGLTEIAGDLRSGAERTAPDPAMQQPGARPTGPVKTLTIQLTPIALGKITVEMRMIGGAMKVDIQVADPKALEMVRSDKDLIMNLLRKAGVVPDTVTIQTADNASSARQNPAGQGGNGSTFDREASRDGSDGSGRNAGPDEHDQGRMSHDDRSTDQSRLRGDIYL